MRGLLVFAAMVLAACATVQPGRRSASTAPAVIAAQVAALEAAWRARDPEAVGRFYSEDAVVVASPVPFRGRSEIVEQWLRPGLPPIRDFEATPEYFVVEGTTIIEVGRYSLRRVSAEQGPESVRGAYSQAWVQQADGTWMVQTLFVS